MLCEGWVCEKALTKDKIWSCYFGAWESPGVQMELG